MGPAVTGPGFLKNRSPPRGQKFYFLIAPTDSSVYKFRRRKKFGDAKILEKKVRVVAIDFVKKSSKSQLSSRFFGRLKILQHLEGCHASSEVPIWRSYEFLSVTSRFVSKNYPRHSEIQLSMIFGGGVNKSISIFFLTFGPKLTCTFLVC